MLYKETSTVLSAKKGEIGEMIDAEWKTTNIRSRIFISVKCYL
jgi:hypothetical protein